MFLPWHTVILASSQANSNGSSIVTVSYIVGSIAAILGILGGLQRFYSKQKQRWTDEGETRAKQVQILEQNTHSVDELMRKMDEFMTSVRTDLSSIRAEISSIGARVTHLERRRPPS
jgi:hypothetical protein